MPSCRLAASSPFLLLLLACGQAPQPVGTNDLQDRTFTLALGESITLGYPVVTFSRVANDSRCGPDVVCIWQGNASIELTECPAWGEGPCHLVTLNTTLEPRASRDGLVPLRLVTLEPAGPPADSTTYRVTLTTQIDSTGPN
jgi:hypothetical protein